MCPVKMLQKKMEMIFGKANQERGFDYLFGYMVKNYYRPRKAERIDHIFIKSISYLMGIANLYKIDLLDALYKKYPRVCPYCFMDPCVCVLTNKQSKLAIPYAQEEQELQEKFRTISNEKKYEETTFEMVYGSLMKIYPNNALDFHRHGSGFHMIKTGEEIAELHEACCRMEEYRPGEKTATWQRVQDEIADVFAWMISEWGLWREGKDMTTAFCSFYENGCTKCGQSFNCNCRPREERDVLLKSEYTKIAIEGLLKKLQSENLQTTFNSEIIRQFNEDIHGAVGDRQIDSVTKKVIEYANKRLRRSPEPNPDYQEIYDEIALLEKAISEEHRYL